MSSIIGAPNPLIVPPPVSGTYSTYSQWSYTRLSFPNGSEMTASMDRTSQTVFHEDGATEATLSPTFADGSVYLTNAELVALPAAEAFFAQLFALASTKLAVQNNPVEPGTLPV